MNGRAKPHPPSSVHLFVPGQGRATHCSEADPCKVFDQEPLIAGKGGGGIACMILLVIL